MSLDQDNNSVYSVEIILGLVNVSMSFCVGVLDLEVLCTRRRFSIVSHPSLPFSCMYHTSSERFAGSAGLKYIDRPATFEHVYLSISALPIC